MLSVFSERLESVCSSSSLYPPRFKFRRKGRVLSLNSSIMNPRTEPPWLWWAICIHMRQPLCSGVTYTVKIRPSVTFQCWGSGQSRLNAKHLSWALTKGSFPKTCSEHPHLRKWVWTSGGKNCKHPLASSTCFLVFLLFLVSSAPTWFHVFPPFLFFSWYRYWHLGPCDKHILIPSLSLVLCAPKQCLFFHLLSQLSPAF